MARRSDLSRLSRVKLLVQCDYRVPGLRLPNVRRSAPVNRRRRRRRRARPLRLRSTAVVTVVVRRRRPRSLARPRLPPRRQLRSRTR